MVFLSKNENSQTDNGFYIDLTGPNPETKNEYKFYKYIEREPQTTLRMWYSEMLKRGYVFKEEYKKAVNEKLTTGNFKNPLNFKDYFGEKFDFIAIDFETANKDRISACAIGLAFMKDNLIVDSDYYYINPPKEVAFSSFNTGIHGIEKEDVKYWKTFDKLWEDDLKNHFNNNLIVLHNASMDASVLKKLFEYYNITNVDIQYVCTMSIAKKLGYPAKLVDLCRKFDITIEKHHDPTSDAVACAEIAGCYLDNGIDIKEYSKKITISQQ